MKTAIGFCLIPLGLVLLATRWLPLGMALIGLGVWVMRRASVGDEARFTGALVVLGGLGAGALLLQGLLDLLRTLS